VHTNPTIGYSIESMKLSSRSIKYLTKNITLRYIESIFFMHC
jgi:hypothetical protein